MAVTNGSRTRFGYGLITCQRQLPDTRSPVELHQEAIELAVEAEELGFDSVWVAEHHFWEDGWTPSPLPICAAIAARTTRIQIATGLVLAPFYHPLRLAEDVATIDLLSSGRLLLGLGIGWQRQEMAAFDVQYKERPKRLLEAIRVMREAWSHGVVEGYGVSVTPKPAQPGGPPIWIGAQREPAIRRAGRVANGFQASLIQFRGSPEAFAQQVGWVREELQAHGRDATDFEFSVSHPTFAWRDGDAWEKVRDYWNREFWMYEEMGIREQMGIDLPSVGEGPPPLTAEREEMIRGSILAGTPDEVAQGICALNDAAGTNIHYLAWLCMPGMDGQLRKVAMRVFAEEVIPQFRD
jgi:alkanesulfonate monooxygenase SsuD/methylene tetrahydromethanopterin reductase-like flavin-dependent oxidoreductase (luciferase family)